MKPFPIPVVPFGPGSQAEDENLDYMPMPKDMSVYLQPALPDAASLAAAPRAHAVLQQITQALAAAGAGEGCA
ncbi:MAG: hydrogenase expression/formation protein, partial [Proteobacteria bacterium]|nr:hydrogenase expression/formation protein [Pseudomonadota bacterium]